MKCATLPHGTGIYVMLEDCQMDLCLHIFGVFYKKSSTHWCINAHVHSCTVHTNKDLKYCNEMLSHYTILLPNSSNFILGTTITQSCSVSMYFIVVLLVVNSSRAGWVLSDWLTLCQLIYSNMNRFTLTYTHMVMRVLE